MASFRTGFKIFGELSIKQGLGRIRSFSEDRKPGRWLPEDQWAVRQPGSTCPEPCDKPRKPPKPSKSWLSVCRDPEPPIECDVRHNNCPPPPAKPDGPWYSLDNLIPKKKHEKPPPLKSCREEMKRQEMMCEEEEVCEKIANKSFPLHIKATPAECCSYMPKEPCPAPVVTLSCPLPKELDIMMWCGNPSAGAKRLPADCQSDKLPYQEFRPQKNWKPAPFSLPLKPDSEKPCSSSGPVAFAEFKQVDIPKPLYTRYKSVELCDSSTLLTMVELPCPDGSCEPKTKTCVPVSPPAPVRPSEPWGPCSECPSRNPDPDPCTEKKIIQAGSCRPVRLKKAPKYTFRPKPTKLIEKVCKTSLGIEKPKSDDDLQFRQPEEDVQGESSPTVRMDSEAPKVITSTLTKEPLCFQGNLPMSHNPPRWMYNLCKPGSKETPLVPPCEEHFKEPDWCSETDGLNFYDGQNEGITPKPAPDPCKSAEATKQQLQEQQHQQSEQQQQQQEDAAEVSPPDGDTQIRSRFVLMPECYNIKQTRFEDPAKADPQTSSFEDFIEAKTGSTKKTKKSYPPIKENILYDLQRMCPNPPFDPTKAGCCRKPPKSDCAAPPKFYRSYSTLSPLTFGNARAPGPLFKIPNRTDCGDSSEKCKIKSIIPTRECPEKKAPKHCAEIALPCCPKARIPPTCNAKRNMPPCKKKLAPKPSFSECSKDPPPCPKMTECNCWEKKNEKNKK